MDTLTEDADRCCERAWTRAALAGALDTVDRFECPKCGCEYRPRQEGPLRTWCYHGCFSLIRAALRT